MSGAAPYQVARYGVRGFEVQGPDGQLCVVYAEREVVGSKVIDPSPKQLNEALERAEWIAEALNKLEA